LLATYTILPFEAALYFNKIQCFCFEEQRLEPNEEVDMPVFFYIDEQYAQDPKLELTDQICLSYTFFESKGSEELANLIKPALSASS
jgi:cytochrome c oxidase assembly protein subunit 11